MKTSEANYSILPNAGDLVEFLGYYYKVWKRDQHGNVYLTRAAASCVVRIERFAICGGHYKIK